MGQSREMTFESAMERLREVVEALEGGDLALESSLTLYREGLACAAFCREKLAQARQELEIWQEGACETEEDD